MSGRRRRSGGEAGDGPLPQGEVELRVCVDPGAEDLGVPRYMTPGAAGIDLRAAVDGELTVTPGDIVVVPTGIRVQVPEGYEAQIRPRSGLAAEHGVTVLNSPGTVDSDYRGPVKVILVNHGPRPVAIARGDRVAQMVVCPVTTARVTRVDSLDDSSRGEGGFGHTGR